jgi:hypothetical protein
MKDVIDSKILLRRTTRGIRVVCGLAGITCAIRKNKSCGARRVVFERFAALPA